MKFDCAIINPPFNGNMDLEFIQKAMKIADHVVVVHPAISSISRKDTKKFVEHKKLLDGHVKSIRMFNGNPVFGIGLFYPCQIVDIDTTKKYDSFTVAYDYAPLTGRVDTFKSLFDVTKWGNVPEYYSLEKKILTYCEQNCDFHSAWRKTKKSITDKWFVNIAKVRGNVAADCMFHDDFYTSLPADMEAESERRKFIQIGFRTKGEAEMCIDYLKTDFARFALAISKNNADLESGELASVPYLPSYKEQWTKEKLTTLFQITDAEWAFIESVIPKYY